MELSKETIHYFVGVFNIKLTAIENEIEWDTQHISIIGKKIFNNKRKKLYSIKNTLEQIRDHYIAFLC